MKVETNRPQNTPDAKRANRAENRAGVARADKHEAAHGPGKNERVRKGGLREVEKGLLRDDRYDYRFSKDDLSIYDRQTNTYVRNWGDPHVHTGDGDKLGFHDNNLTYDLPNGTKVTLKPTEKDANGAAFIDSIAISTKRRGVVIEGVHSEAGPQRGRFMGAEDVDGQYEDGITLTAPNEIDDLYYDGVELQGHDGRGGDRSLDALFAAKANRPTAASGDFVVNMMNRLDELGAQIEDWMSILIEGKQVEQDKETGEFPRDPDGKPIKEKDEKGEPKEMSDGQRFFLQTKIQKALQTQQELRQLLTDLLKSEHDARMQVINNLPGN